MNTNDSYFVQELKLEKLSSNTVKFFMTKIFPVIFGTGSFWNLLIIVYFVKTNVKKGLKKLSSYHFLILNLTTVDLFISVGSTVFWPAIYQLSWELGEFTCVFLHRFFINICPMTSSWILVLLSHARYRTIVHPMKKRFSKVRYTLFLMIIWMLSIVSKINDFLSMKYQKDENGVQKCTHVIKGESLFIKTSIEFFFDSCVPLGIMIFLYRKMNKTLKNEQQLNSFHLSCQSRRRNRAALNTIRNLTCCCFFLFFSASKPSFARF